MPFTVWALALAQALLGTGNILLVAINGLIGSELATHKALITMPIALQFLGMILATLPAAQIMQRLGRKVGFALGNAFGLLGTFVALGGLNSHDIWHFAVGTFLIGIAIGTSQQYRFAALDVTKPKDHSKAVSLVLAGGVLAAIVGPNLADLSRSWYEGSVFVGAFYGLFALYAIAFLLIVALPLPKPVKVAKSAHARSFGEIFSQPIMIAAVTSGVIGYFVMVLLMTATPLAMQADNYPFSDITTIIQWHVLGMFVPSFFTGHLIRRFSSRSVVLAGFAMLLASNLIAIADQSYWFYFVSLVLLGVGWNFSFIGGTHLLSFGYKPVEQGKSQGMNEFLVFTAAAIGSLLAGQGIAYIGWTNLNLLSIPFVIAATIVIYRLKDIRAIKAHEE